MVWAKIRMLWYVTQVLIKTPGFIQDTISGPLGESAVFV